MEIDYSGVEVRVAECYHLDPNMYTYICDKTTDMHRDMAMKLYLLSDKEWTKMTRYCAKNKYVFPSFYGSYFKQTAKDLWDAIEQLKLTTRDGLPLYEHLRSKGVTCYEEFQDHVQKVDDWFWNEKFAKYTEWKEEHIENYQRDGYFDSLTGFRYQGYMKRNEALNYNIQGSAFHCLLRSLIRINQILREEGWKTRIVGQIHDSFVADVDPYEINDFMILVRRIMVTELMEDFQWINVPIEIETELTPKDRPWAEKKEIFQRPRCKCGCDWNWKEKVEFSGGRTAEMFRCVSCEELEDDVPM
jgi:DNA polymerase-1